MLLIKGKSYSCGYNYKQYLMHGVDFSLFQTGQMSSM